LHRHLDVLAHLGQFRHSIQDAVAEIAGMRGEEAHAPETVNVMHRPQQVSEIGTRSWTIVPPIVAIAIHNLA